MARKRPYPENILHDLKVDGATIEDLDFSHLPERETSVVQMYYIENTMTLREIADAYEVTELRMRQIINKALRKIRKYTVQKINSRQAAETY